MVNFTTPQNSKHLKQDDKIRIIHQTRPVSKSCTIR